MSLLVGRNTNDLSHKVYKEIDVIGEVADSRNGLVVRFPWPMTLCYSHSWERVNFCPVRDANPFFHLMEGLAMLAGHNSVDWLSRFNEGMRRYSDDNKTFNAFYGTRLRNTWGDQLENVVTLLRENRNTRQAVCQIWDPQDLLKETRDKACNTQIVFSIRKEKLQMTVFNRSNDAIWGSVSGANVVHFSMFQEYVALKLGLQMGAYYQISNDLHVYTENPQWEKILKEAYQWNMLDEDYPENQIRLFEKGQGEDFDASLELFMKDTQTNEIIEYRYGLPFFDQVAVPMFNTWVARKYLNAPVSEIESHLLKIKAEDWQRACLEWVSRREDK